MKAGDFKKIVLDNLQLNIQNGSRASISGYKKALDKILDIADEAEIPMEEIEDQLRYVQAKPDNLAESLTNVFTRGLLEWYLEEPGRIYFMEGAVKELGAQDGFTILSKGQYLYWVEVLLEVTEKGLEVVEGPDSIDIDLTEINSELVDLEEIAEADWDDEVLLEEVLEDLNLAEIELDETIEIDIEDQNNKEIKN